MVLPTGGDRIAPSGETAPTPLLTSRPSGVTGSVVRPRMGSRCCSRSTFAPGAPTAVPPRRHWGHALRSRLDGRQSSGRRVPEQHVRFRSPADRRPAAAAGRCGRNAPALRQCLHRDCRDRCHRRSAGLCPMGRHVRVSRGGVAALRPAGLGRQIPARPPLSARVGGRDRQPPLESGLRGWRGAGGGRLGCRRDPALRTGPADEPGVSGVRGRRRHARRRLAAGREARGISLVPCSRPVLSRPCAWPSRETRAT